MVRVLWRTSGKPAEGIKVAIGMAAAFSGTAIYDSTNENGEAHFDMQPTEGNIYINGELKYKGVLSGRVVLYI